MIDQTPNPFTPTCETMYGVSKRVIIIIHIRPTELNIVLRMILWGTVMRECTLMRSAFSENFAPMASGSDMKSALGLPSGRSFRRQVCVLLMRPCSRIWNLAVARLTKHVSDDHEVDDVNLAIFVAIV